MSFSNNSSPRRGVPLSPTRRSRNNSSYFEKAREVSSKFDDLENKISILEDECVSFKKAINSGRRLVQEERNQINIRAKNLQRKINTPQHPSPRSRAQDLIDYSDEIEQQSYYFETPHPNNRLSRKQRIMESTFSTTSAANPNNNYTNNYYSMLNNPQNNNYKNPNNNSMQNNHQNNSYANSMQNDHQNNSYTNSMQNNHQNNSYTNSMQNNHHNNSYTNPNNNFMLNNNRFSRSFTPKRDYSSINDNSSYNDDSSSNSTSYSKNKYDRNDSESSFEYSQSNKKQSRGVDSSKKILSRNEISPVLSKSMEMYRKDEADLSQRLKEMKKKILKIDERVSEAQKILSIPIDDIETEIKLTEEAESNLIKVQNRLNSNDESDNFFEDYDEMISNIEFIESQNNKHRKELKIKRKRLDEMKKLISRKRNSLSNYKNISDNNKSRSSSNDKAFKKIDEAHEKLKQRSLNIQNEEEEIDKYENELILKRKQMEQDWKIKMKRIEDLSSIKRDVDCLNLNIHSEETEIDQLQNILNDLKKEKNETKKRIANSTTESSRNLTNYPQITNDKINQKQRQIKLTSRKLKEKKRKINRLEETVRKLIISMKLFNDQVEHLEAQVEEMGQTTEEQLDDLQRETTQLSRTLTTLRSPTNEKNSFQQNKSGESTEEFIDSDNYD